MSVLKLYFGHALSEAPDQFRDRMFAVRDIVSGFEGVEMLNFNWVPGKGPSATINTHEFDTEKVLSADLMFATIEYLSLGLGGEFEVRLTAKKPLLIFTPKGRRLTRYFLDYIREVRAYFMDRHDINAALDFPDPFEYADDAHMIGAVYDWIEDHRVVSPVLACA